MVCANKYTNYDITFSFTIGLGLIVASINVIYRDIQHFVEVIFMAWFYITPIVYPMDMVPDNLKMVAYINPLTSYIEGLRNTLLYNSLPDKQCINLMVIYSCVFLVVGEVIFKKIEYRFAEEI